MLIIKGSEEDSSKKLGVELNVFKQSLEKSKKIMYEVRQNRPKPHMDDKFVTSWNGMYLKDTSNSLYNLKVSIIFA